FQWPQNTRNKMWYYTLFLFLFLTKNSHQQYTTREILQHITIVMEENANRLSNIEEKLSHNCGDIQNKENQTSSQDINLQILEETIVQALNETAAVLLNDIKTTSPNNVTMKKINKIITDSQDSTIKDIKKCIKDSQETAIEDIKKYIRAVGCQDEDGFIRSSEGDQCYKPFQDVSMSWDAADIHCQQHGMRLAKPNNPVSINAALNTKYGDKSYWLGAKGTGPRGAYEWYDGEHLSTSNGLWFPGLPSSTDATHCLGMGSYAWAIAEHPGKVYGDATCTDSSYPLCEVIMN
ncbi:unnamed protein product, partial [Meganyctiphanes norvegica]